MSATAIERIPPAGGQRGRLALPRVFHVVWLDGAPPAPVAQAAESWQELHPGWQVIVWSEATLPPLRNQAIFDACTSHDARTALARYELLHRYGGVAVAAGVSCRRSLEPLLEGVQSLLVATPQKGVTGALLGCTPGHPFASTLLGSVARAIAAKPQDDPAGLLGDDLLTEVVRAVATGERTMAANLGADDLPTVLRPHLFFPGSPLPAGERDEGVIAVLGASASEAAGAEAPRETRRFVCVLDTQAPAALSMMLRSFCTLFGTSDPVELAVCVPGEPGQAEAGIVGQLLNAIAPDPNAAADVVLYSFAEAATLPWQAAVVAPGDHVAAGLEAADALAAMTETRAALDGGAPQAPQRPGAELRKRLAARTDRTSRPTTRAERRARR